MELAVPSIKRGIGRISILRIQETLKTCFMKTNKKRHHTPPNIYLMLRKAGTDRNHQYAHICGVLNPNDTAAAIAFVSSEKTLYKMVGLYGEKSTG